MDKLFLTGTTWRHRKRGGLYRVRRFDDQTDTVFLAGTGGQEISVNPGQLANLYDEDEFADFPEPSSNVDADDAEVIAIGRLALELNPAPVPAGPKERKRIYSKAKGN